MPGICIISGTNREDSKTYKVAQIYQQVLKEKSSESRIFSLTQLPHNFAFADMFGKRTAAFEALLEEYIVPYEKFIFIAPEYNGSFPGVLKTFLDAIHPRYWTEKKAALVGVSDGRAGNLRGMEHLTNILHHLKMHVHHYKVPVSQVDKILDDQSGKLLKDIEAILGRQGDAFIRF